ncbi:hypothetical protein [Burkholderia cepacia]|uniref:hypothetical protein n=1 Tax=Burkholderia cepacia TaxID=292 RepID=UPI002FE1102C
MYIDVPRGLVFFGQTDAFLPEPALVQYDRDSKTITSVAGAQTDDTVCDVSRDMGEFGEVRSTNILFNESGSQLCLPLPETARCNWAEDRVIDSHTGAVEHAIQRHRGPPARLAADWFGDRLLTHGREIVDFYTGKVTDMLSFKSAASVVVKNIGS